MLCKGWQEGADVADKAKELVDLLGCGGGPITMTLMPFNLCEWIVMPMGLRNSPATHQHRVTLALSDLIGNICVYLDDIIIWSSLLAEHCTNVSRVLEAICTAKLYCSLKKSNLFTSTLT